MSTYKRVLKEDISVIPVDDGDVVEINYVGRVKNSGEIFDLTDPEVADEEDIDTSNMELRPVKVLLGEGYVIEGLEEAIKGMEMGEEHTVTIPKEKAFGSRKSENIKTISKREFENYDVNPRRGMPVEIDGKRGKILTVSSGRVKVDFNHPLAGQDLEYDVETLRKIEDTEERVRAVVEFHVSMDFDVEMDGETAHVTINDEVPEGHLDELEAEIEKLSDVEGADVTAQNRDDAAGD